MPLPPDQPRLVPELTRAGAASGAPAVFDVEKNFRLRWAFEFQDGRRRVGIWDYASQRPDEMAAYVNRTGCTWAVVEGEHVATAELVRILEVPGHLYHGFQWIDVAAVPGGGLAALPVGKHRIRGITVGIACLTPDRRYEVLADGRVYVTARSAADQALLIGNV